jgi:hypothetical protein
MQAQKLKEIKPESLVSELNKAGITAKEYSNPSSIGTPIEFFITTVAGGKGILVKNGLGVVLKINADKKKKQAVLSVHEGERTIERKVKFNHFKNERYTSGQLEDRAKLAFPIVVPGATFTVSNVKKLANKNKDVHQKKV